jgi:predicted CxxxxCH...CXXCH cytochrome family protein
MRALFAAMLVHLAAGCASPQPLEQGVRRQGTTWKQDVAPALAESCGSCHTGNDPAAGFRTDDYFQVIARARAGDATSLLLTIQSDAIHAPFASTFALLRTWVVDDDLGYETSHVHGPGLMNPSDPTFHGTVARDLIKWNLATCGKCHGTDFAGGTSGVTCKTCHEGGLTSCTGCHGQPPQTGAHVAHVLGAALSTKLDCTECHVKPAVYTDAGHLHSGPGTVRFGALASSQSATPTYDVPTKTCSGVYCHGSTFTDTAAMQRAPTWSGGADQAACGTCHGLPPSGHQNTGDRCVNCHSRVVDDQRHILDVSKHVNGAVDFGLGEGCTSCHGQPPNTGSHVAHVTAAHQLAAPVACGDCHTVPATVDAPGHLTKDAQVTLTGVRATGGGRTQPVWDSQTHTCSNVSCHGVEQPQWGGGQDVIACGSCHGIPPATAAHDPSLKLSDCVQCHAGTVVAGGAIKVGGAHINGMIDVQN